MSARPVLDTLIIGGGWAGLSAACHLTALGQRVALLERAPQLGGRARAVPFGQDWVDNGQHLMIGAYQALFELLQIIGVDPWDKLQAEPLTWSMYERNRTQFTLKFRRNAKLWHRLKSLLSVQGLPLRQRLELIVLAQRFPKLAHQADRDLAHTFAQLQISPKIRSHLLDPLCLAALSTPAAIASQQIFAQVWQQAFRGPAQYSDFIFAKDNLSTVLPDPALTYLQQQDQIVQLNSAVQSLHIEQNTILGVSSHKEGLIKANQVLLATSPQAAARLIEPHPELHDMAAQLSQIKPCPITTVYCRYDHPIALPELMFGGINSMGQWFFDRRHCQQPNMASIIITGSGPHDNLNNKQLAAHVSAEIAPFINAKCQLVSTKVIRERFGAFLCEAPSDHYRPNCRTPVSGLWLAGDYCATGLPASLEGAVLSGKEAAQQIYSKREFTSRAASKLGSSSRPV